MRRSEQNALRPCTVSIVAMGENNVRRARVSAAAPYAPMSSASSLHCRVRCDCGLQPSRARRATRSMTVMMKGDRSRRLH